MVAKRSGWHRLLLMVLGIASIGARQAQGPAVRLQVPLTRQPYNLCLPASVSMVLSYWGLEIATKTIGERVTVYKGGTTGEELLRVVEQMGFMGFLIQPSFEDLLQHLERGRPLIIELSVGDAGRHAMVLVGFDLGRQLVWLNDPATGKATSTDLPSFRQGWSAAGRWTFLILPK